jgi:hypothetical protein
MYTNEVNNLRVKRSKEPQMDFIKKTYSELFQITSHQSTTNNTLLKDLIEYATRWAWTNGLCFVESPPSLKSIYLIPFSLLPCLVSILIEHE